MKAEICLAATLDRGSPTLVAVSAALHHHAVRPESFVWTVTPETDEARAWLHVEAEPQTVEALLAEFRTLPGVSSAAAHQPGQAIVTALRQLSDPPWSEQKAVD